MKKIAIIIPVFNEEYILEDSIQKVLEFCRSNLSLAWQITIVDNKSTDKTAEIGKKLARDYNNIKYLYIDEAGKGIAIKSGWQDVTADFYLFMDADLATDLSAMNLAVEELEKGADLVLGSRLHPDSKTERSLVRRFFSWGYRFFVKSVLSTKISDTPCGFKAINFKVKEELLHQIENKKWFFDSELVLLAEKNNFRIKEIPVSWKDRRTKKDKSKVKIFSLSVAYAKEVIRLKKRLKK